MKAYALAAGEGRTYEWHDVVFVMKAAAPETGGAAAIWEVTTRPGEEPHQHVHEEDEIFYVLSGLMRVRCGEESFDVADGGFVFLPRGIPHDYTIHSDEVRMLGMSLPSTFGDNVERMGSPVAGD